MSRLFFTGDTHMDQDINKLDNACFLEQKNLTDKDYVFICGDFGGVWYADRKCPESVRNKYITLFCENDNWGKDTAILDLHESKNYTTLFVDGNHENHMLLNCYPVEEWNGGLIHRIRKNIIHLMRGQVYHISGKTIFTMGGAESTDKMYRVENISWWKQEMPSVQEYETALSNLDKCDWRVDYVVTHDICNSVRQKLHPEYKTNQLISFFNVLEEKLCYQRWFFGHHHRSGVSFGKHICLYNTVIEEKLL